MAACAQCGSAVPRGANACPSCGAAVVRVAKRAAAGPRATAAPAVRPVVKAVAEPVAPRVKSGAAPPKPTPKVTPKVAPKRVPDAAAPPAKPARAVSSRRRATGGSEPAGTAPAASSAEAPGDAGTAGGGRAAAATSRRAAAAKTAPAPPDAPAPAATADALAAAYDVPDAAPVGAPAPVAPVADPARPAAPSADQVGTGRRRRASGDVIGDADERSPHEPVAPEPGPRPPLPPAVAVEYEPADDRARWPLALRVVRGDWLPALSAALPALVATVVVAAVAAASLFLATKPEGDDLLVGETSAGRWVRYVCAAVGMAFGGPLRVSYDRGGDEFGDDFDAGGLDVGTAVRFVPLTVTLLCLLALWFFARRAHERNVTPDRLPDAIRTAAVFAVGVGVVAWLGRWEVGSTGEENDVFAGVTTTSTFSMSPWRPMFWAFLAALLVVWLASGQLVVTGRWAGWLLAARGALAGLAAGVAVSFVLLVVLGIAYADRAGGDATDVLNGLPLALSYGVGAAAAAFGVLSGGRFVVPAQGRTQWSLLAPWLPKPYLVLLVVPALAVAFATWYLLRRSGAPREEALRASGRMGVPAALLWLIVCAVGTPHLSDTSFGFSAVTTVGPVLWSALLVWLWFGAGGWLAARLLAPRLAPVPVPVDPPEPAT